MNIVFLVLMEEIVFEIWYFRFYKFYIYLYKYIRIRIVFYWEY